MLDLAWIGIGGYVALIGVLTERLVMASKKKTKEPSLQLQLSPVELQALEEAAGRNSVSVTEYARVVLVSSLPLNTQKNLMSISVPNAEPTPTSLIEQARNRENDRSVERSPTRLPTTVPSVQTPARRSAPSSPQGGTARDRKPAPMSLPQVPPGDHPCFNLSKDNIPGHLTGQCQGLCQHSSQRGRICYWPPTSASNCDVFESKAIRTAPR